MLTWLAKRFEKNRAELQARLESSLRVKESSTETSTTLDFLKSGNEFLSQGKLSDAEACYRKGILADAKNAACYSNLGFILLDQGRKDEAERMLGHAIGLNPADADALFLLGNVARDRLDWSAAVRHYQSALSVKPEFAHCQQELCIALARCGRILEARQVLGQGLAFDPNTAPYHHFKGGLHLAANELDDAIDGFQKADQLFPRHPEILLELCSAYVKRCDVYSALDTGRRVLALEPQNAQANYLMAVALGLCGQHDLALENFRAALTHAPQDIRIRQGLLCALAQQGDWPPADYLNEARVCADTIRATARPYSQWPSLSRAGDHRALRVGFVLGDLNNEVVSEVLAGMLPMLDPLAITCVAYASLETETPATARFRPMFSEWTSVLWMHDSALAQKIHDDNIDVLLDLSGHNSQNRLAVFAWRPAPVQVAWLGFAASTGLAEIDYILVDKAIVRVDEADHFSEKFWLLPDSRLCLQASVVVRSSVESKTPFMRNGFVTFGSFQALSQLTDTVLKAWSQILCALPSARLRLQNRILSNAECVLALQARLQEARFDMGRVDILGSAAPNADWTAVEESDILLDTFPNPACIATAQALLRGVPTVTLAGHSLLARQGESLMRQLDLHDWVAADEEDYVELALKHASNRVGLLELRTRLRSASLAAPLFDVAAFSKNFVDCMRQIADQRPRVLAASASHAL